MNSGELTKFDESLFIFNRLSDIFENLADFEIKIEKYFFHEPKKEKFKYNIYTGYYLFIEQFLYELKIFKSLGKHNDKIMSFFQENKDDIKPLNKISDNISLFRNQQIGHSCRDKNGNFVHALDLINTPCTAPEVKFYANYCNIIFTAINSHFNSEMKNAINKVRININEKSHCKIVDIANFNNILEKLRTKFVEKYC